MIKLVKLHTPLLIITSGVLTFVPFTPTITDQEKVKIIRDDPTVGFCTLVGPLNFFK